MRRVVLVVLLPSNVVPCGLQTLCAANNYTLQNIRCTLNGSVDEIVCVNSEYECVTLAKIKVNEGWHLTVLPACSSILFWLPWMLAKSTVQLILFLLSLALPYLRRRRTCRCLPCGEHFVNCFRFLCFVLNILFRNWHTIRAGVHKRKRGVVPIHSCSRNIVSVADGSDDGVPLEPLLSRSRATQERRTRIECAEIIWN